MAEGKARKSHDDVLSFLDDLDSYSAAAPRGGAPAPAPGSKGGPSPSGHPPASQPEDAQSVLDFLDEITQRSSTPTASLATKKPTLTSSRPLSRAESRNNLTGAKAGVTDAARQSIDSARSARSVRGPVPTSNIAPTLPDPATTPTQAAAQAEQPAGGGWGWGSVFKQASSVLQQAKTVAEHARTAAEGSELVKNLNQNIQHTVAGAAGQGEHAKKWGEGVLTYMKAHGIEQIGKDLSASGIKSLTDIIHAVAPPIAEHEIIEVQLSYDMIGYDGIENLVYRALAKIMEQVEGGDLVLNKGEEEKPREPGPDDPERDLQTVEGLQEGYKLARANLDSLIKRKYTPKPKEPAEHARTDSNSTTLPITHCPVFVRIQPVLAPLPTFSASPAPKEEAPGTAMPGTAVEDEKHLFFVMLLRDPSNELSHATLSQSMPASWLDVPFEENEWVEDVMVEVIRRATEVIGQQYVNGRLTGRSIKNTANVRPSSDSARSTKAEDAALAVASVTAVPGVV